MFGELNQVDTVTMWRGLLGRAKDLSVSFQLQDAEGDTVPVHWGARYTFGQTGRKVRNVVRARLTVRDGVIVRHTDAFSFWRWSRQALGLPG